MEEIWGPDANFHFQLADSKLYGDIYKAQTRPVC